MKSGAEQFTDWLARRGLNHIEAADLLGWDPTMVSKVASGKRIPGRKNAIQLEDVCGISIRAWESSDLDKSGSVVVTVARKRK